MSRQRQAWRDAQLVITDQYGIRERITHHRDHEFGTDRPFPISPGFARRAHYRIQYVLIC